MHILPDTFATRSARVQMPRVNENRSVFYRENKQGGNSPIRISNLCGPDGQSCHISFNLTLFARFCYQYNAQCTQWPWPCTVSASRSARFNGLDLFFGVWPQSTQTESIKSSRGACVSERESYLCLLFLVFSCSSICMYNMLILIAQCLQLNQINLCQLISEYSL